MKKDGRVIAELGQARSRPNDALLLLAKFQVREAEALIVKQERLVANMERNSHPVALAEARALLTVLHYSLRCLRETLLRRQEEAC